MRNFIILIVLALVCTGCGFTKVTDTRSGRVYAKKGPAVPFWEGGAIEFTDSISRQKVRLESYEATPISKQTYLNLIGASSERSP